MEEKIEGKVEKVEGQEEEERRGRGHPKGSEIITPEVVEIVCKRLAEGESLISICKDIDIKKGTFLSAILKNKDYFDQYATSRDMQADVLVDEILEIADKSNYENYNAQRLKVDARKWIASKLKPKKYGDKIQVDGNVTTETYEQRLRRIKKAGQAKNEKSP